VGCDQLQPTTLPSRQLHEPNNSSWLQEHEWMHLGHWSQRRRMPRFDARDLQLNIIMPRRQRNVHCKRHLLRVSMRLHNIRSMQQRTDVQLASKWLVQREQLVRQLHFSAQLHKRRDMRMERQSVSIRLRRSAMLLYNIDSLRWQLELHLGFWRLPRSLLQRVRHLLRLRQG